ncbi:RHS repeat-associated core domain-containing protein [Thermomonospora amylolytica]|uniref:RHS repeat-associated core domain-containing protein n=1 Tax=Thermomonospora amylolytica TaxID=1411117 RepID=UPI00130087FD|nr:RHS repeat-associated core domain-containing protein [Thermomonospora amylolytica]
MAVVLTLGLAAPVPAAQAADGPKVRFKDTKPVQGRHLAARPRKTGSKNVTTAALPAPKWPQAATADATLGAPGKWTQAGRLPVWVTAPDPKTQRPSAGRTVTPAKQVRVQVVDHALSRRAGVQGVMLAVSRTDASAPGQVTVGLNYATFATAFGGAYGSRLRLVRYPSCVLTTPERAECRRPTPVSTVRDARNQTLIAQIEAAATGTGATSPPTPSASPSAGGASRNRPLSGALVTGSAQTAGATVLATAAGTSSDLGDYKATQLSPSSTWNVGLNTGEFTWSYPMRVPPVPGGVAPNLSIGYSSGAVDGRTSNTNSQSSWVGDGFELWPGYIERRYKSCEDDGAPKDEWGNSPGDLCWGYDNATITWNGRGGELVPDGDGRWRLKNDDGTRIEKLQGNDDNTGNGDADNEYWKVTTTDGTRYYFGKHRLEGWSTGKAVTNSAWTVPVFGDDSGEPCHKTTGFGDSWCQQAWRWNLDYVVDPDGNAIVYYYDQERNHYGRNLKPEDETPYVRGGVLNRIEYGLRSDNLWAKAPARVMFTAKERCLDTEANCAPDKIETNQNLWEDTPWDLNCAAGTECKDFHGTVSPTFWTRLRLESVKTQVIRSDGTWRDVDSWKIGHKWGTADYDRSLLPISIQHTGHAASSSITLPKVTLDYEERYNRVRYGDTGGFMRYRLDYIADEFGSEISVAYSTAQCTADALPTPESNTKRCFPVYWAYEGEVDPRLDWFHKYVVTHVIARDRTGRNPNMVTKYVYDDDAAWHYDDDDGLTKEKYKTWSQWRGYGKVSVLTGSDLADDMVAQTDHYFLRGMHGDRSSATDKDQTRTVNVSDGNGGTVPDHNAYAGHALRTVRLTGPNGRALDWEQSLPKKFQTASKTRPWGTITADIVVTEYNRKFTALDGGGWRIAEIQTNHDADTGRVNWISDNGDTGASGDERCVRYTYADNIDAWMRSHVAQQELTAGTCQWSGLDRTKHVLSDTRTYYDGTSTAPKSAFKSISRGRTTYTERLVSHAEADGSAPTYQMVSSVTGFDEYGRATRVSDATGNVTVASYTQVPSTGPGLTNRVTVTRPKVTKEDGSVVQLSSSTTMDTAWGLPIVEIDESGGKTEAFYDALGRRTRIWLPDRNRTSGHSPSIEYTYQITENAPVVVGTKTVTNNGTMGPPTYVIYDGFLRERQTQAPGQDGGRVITDIVHDGRGLVSFTYNGYYNDQAGPTPELFGPDTQGLVNSQTRYTYDGAGRKVREALLNGAGDAPEVSATVYTYGSDATGNWTNADPPTGGTPTTTYTDVRGRPIELRQYNGASPAGDHITTQYTLDLADRITKIVGPGSKVWEHHFDTRGREVRTVDPDKGVTTTEYNNLDLVVSITDARHTDADKTKGKVFYQYDALGRKTKTLASNAQGQPGAVIASWTYDTVRPGQLTSSTRRGVGADGTTVYDYTTTVNAYDNLNRPTRTTITLPAGAEGAGLDGSYQFNTSYNPDGTIQSMSMPAAGGLAAEVLTYTYDDLSRPTGLSGLSSYVTGTSYTNVNQLRGYVLSTGGRAVNVGFDYDPTTQWLTRATVSREGINGYDRNATYTYDQAGNVTQITDVIGHADTGGTVTDTQCFRYDGQRRLAHAWTQDGTECASDPASAQIGGPDPYRKKYTYSPDGNRTKEEHWAAGPNGGDWSWNRDYRYAGDSGVGTGYKGHQLADYTQQADGGQSKTYTYTYDAIGNTIRRAGGGTTLDFEWDAVGELSKVTDSAEGSATFVYTADGDRLVRRDSTGTVLYLPGMEVRLAGGATEAIRYYAHGDQVVAMRTSDGVTFLAGDHQGTSQLAIDAYDLTTISRRRYSPFGEDRGSTTGTWPTAMDKGFVGGTEDPTGLTHLGAREYDPGTGRFISVDPLMDLADPQQMNGYAYANNNPVTFSDPDGLLPIPYCYLNPFGCAEKKSVKDRLKDLWNFVGGLVEGMVQGAVNAIAGTANAIRKEARDLENSFRGFVSGSMNPGGPGPPPKPPVKEYQAPNFDLPDLGFDRNSPIHRFGHDIGEAVGPPLPGIGALKLAKPLSRLFKTCRRNSFVPGTPVLLADGTSKPIEDVAVGDKVLATDPETGRTEAKTVTDTITGEGEKQLVEITVDTDGPAGDKTGKITATDEHPFWVAGFIRQWINAEDLRPGMWLHTSAGTQVQVKAAHSRTTLRQRVHNLTVADIHTYHVLVGQTPVLVHNVGPGCGTYWISSDKLPHHYMSTDKNGVMHAREFGVEGPYNKANGQAFVRAIERLVKNPGTMQIRGTFRNRPAIHYVDETGLHASFAADGPNVGEYLGGWRSSGDQLTYLLLYGKL